MPPSRDEGPDSGHVVLSDGSTALLRIAQPSDADELQHFVERLSPEARRHRFFSETAPPAEVIRTLCDPSDPRRSLTVIALRRQDGALRVIASGSYHARDPHQAEVAMAVDDRLHGHGLGSGRRAIPRSRLGRSSLGGGLLVSLVSDGRRSDEDHRKNGQQH